MVLSILFLRKTARSMAQKLSYNGQQVYDHDHDRFLTVLFAPTEKREALFALYAFNHEIAKTREVVTDTMIGTIRLQWWRDAIDKLYTGEVLEHEVLKGLSPVISRLEQKDFHALIEARESDLQEEVPATLDDLLKYAEQTTVPLTRLGCQILGDKVDDEVIRAVSVAYALTGILRSVPRHIGEGRFLLPLDLLAKYDVSPTTLTDKNYNKKLKPVIEEIYNKILKYNKIYKGFSFSPVLLTGVLARGYAHTIKRHDFDVFNDIKTPFAVLSLAKAYLLKRL